MVSIHVDGPGSAGGRPRTGHYLVGSHDPGTLAGLVHTLDDEVDVAVRVIGGTPEQPTILAVAMSDERMAHLREEFGDRLLIESDPQVDPYGSGDRR